MTDTWDRTLFDKDLKAILQSKLPVSASKITGLQALAIAHPTVRNEEFFCK
jgi:protein NRD1